MARRATTQVLGSMYLMNTAQIFKESMRIILLNPTQYHSISIFLFSPLPISLFLSHFLINHFPQQKLLSLIFGFYPQLAKTIVHIIVCFPSSITFSLLGRAATVQAVSDSYSGIRLDGRRLLKKSAAAWIKLLHTSFWELFIFLGLSGILAAGIVIVPEILRVFAICSEPSSGLWGVVVVLGVPFCVAFAHLMVIGNLARVLTVLESDCYGFESLLKANNLMVGRRRTALIVALLSSLGFRSVECLFEMRMSTGINFWELPVLVSMYSSVLILDTVMNVVFYYSCKSFND